MLLSKRDEVQKDLCRLLSKPVGRAMSPLEGAKDINLFMYLLGSTETRFSVLYYLQAQIPGETK